MKKLIIFTLFVSLFSCSKKDENPQPSKSKLWDAVKQNSDDTVSVKDGYLYLSTEYDASASRSGISISSINRLKGNFEVKVRFSFFKPSGADMFSDYFAVSLTNTSPGLADLGGSLSNSFVYVEDPSSIGSNLVSTSSREGEFYAKRVGGNFEAWMRAGEDTSFYERTNYITADMTLSFLLASLDDTVDRTSVRIDEVEITGGGGKVLSDDFSVNRVSIAE